MPKVFLFQKNYKICIIGDERHIDEAKQLGYDCKVNILDWKLFWEIFGNKNT